MDNKNYNVDDILADIKSRKAKQKGKVSDSSVNEPSSARPQPPQDRVYERRAEAKAPMPYVPPAAQRPPKQTDEKKPSGRLEFGSSIPDLAEKVRPRTSVTNPDVAEKARPRTSVTTPDIAEKVRPRTAVTNPDVAEKVRPRTAVTNPDLAEKVRPRTPPPVSKSGIGVRNPAKDLVFDAAAASIESEKPLDTPKGEMSVRPKPQGQDARLPALGDNDSPTRVLPKVRDLKTGDIKKFDFGKFAIEQDAGTVYADNEDNGIPEGSLVDYSEYNSVSDKRDVQRDIAHVKLWLFFRVCATFALNIALFMFTLSGKYEAIPLPESLWPVPETMRAYLMACTVITILIALVNSSSVGGGLMGLFRGHANSDTLAACAIIATVGQGVSSVANFEIVEPANLSLYFCVAALAMLFNGFGKMTMINRILSNFKIIAADNEPKKALLAVENDNFCHEFIKDASTRRPVIAYSVRAGFFSDFLALSYSDKYDVGINRAVAPVCLVGSLVVGAATYFLTGNSFSAISAFCAVLCVCATLSSTFIENVPLSKLTKKLAPDGGMVSGNKAVEDYCDTRAFILDENDLFPKGNVRMHGIRAFSHNRIDEAILDAASVLCAINGTLAPVFLEMIGGNKKLLKKVDNIVFENGMGISAWVDQRRVLIGNRKLMLNHGITLPAEAAQKQSQLSAEAEPLFLSNSGEAFAQFTVSYHIDEELATQLDHMAVREKLLIVKTMDANITAEKIWELYGYPMELIRVLPAEWHSKYDKMAAPRETAIAEIVYPAEKASTFVKAILACIAARSSILSATVIQLIQIVFGYALVTFMAFMGTIGSISIVQICLYQLFWFCAIFIVQKARQS